MSNFVVDDLNLPPPKVDITDVPAGRLAVNYVQASDWNAHRQSILDIKVALRGASVGYGLTAQASDPAPTGVTNYLWLKNDATLWLTVAGTAAQVGSGGSGLQLINGNAGTVAPGSAVYCSSAGHFNLAKADSPVTGFAVGIVTASTATNTLGSVQSSSPVTLTTAQWDAICGTTGGLAFGVPYYLSASTAGAMSATPPSLVGTVKQQVLIGVSPTTAIVSVSAPVVSGSGTNTIQLRNDNAGAMIIGTPVYSDASAGMNQGLADGSGKSNLVGLVVDVSVASGAQGTVAVGGLVVATTAQWDAICGTTGGLTFNAPYYLHKATPGRLSATPPASPADSGKEVVQVITALSATQARIAITSPILL